jgi:hypothetical protein
MAKIAKTADRKKVMDTSKNTDCPKCGKPRRIVKRVKDRERGECQAEFLFRAQCANSLRSCEKRLLAWSFLGWLQPVRCDCPLRLFFLSLLLLS